MLPTHSRTSVPITRTRLASICLQLPDCRLSKESAAGKSVSLQCALWFIHVARQLPKYTNPPVDFTCLTVSKVLLLLTATTSSPLSVVRDSHCGHSPLSLVS